MKATIARILHVEKKGDCFITTILFIDGGEEFQATGVGDGFEVGDPIIAFIDDRYNRLKFKQINIA